MRKFIFLLMLAATTSSVPRIACSADTVPQFDIARNCKAETADTSGIGETLASCMKDEEDARRQLVEQWDRFARDDKAACIRATSADGTPSYVELVTCLEIAYDRARFRTKQ